MVNRKKVYLNIALFSTVIAIIIAIFSNARKNMVLNTNGICYLSSIVFILFIIQIIIIIYNEINELRGLSYNFHISFRIIEYINLSESIKEKLSAIYTRMVSTVQLQVIRC